MIIAGAKISEYIDNKQKKIIMAFKMTPGIKGNPAMNRIKNLGACGGPGQPPCEPRFQKEVEERRMKAIDRSSSAIRKSIKSKKKDIVIGPIKPAPPVKLQINLPKGYEFADKKQKMMFYAMFEEALENGKYETQEQLDKAIMQQLKGGGPGGPKEPPVVRPPGKDTGVVISPKDPKEDYDDDGYYMEDPKAPIKGGGEFEASPIKGVIKK